MHEFEADRRTIGPAQQGEHLADGRVFEAENIVDEDRAVVIGFGKAVGLRAEFLGVAARLELERIEVGMQMSAHAECADHHQGANAVARRLLQLLFGDAAPRFGLGLDGLADRGFRGAPVAVESGDDLAVGDLRPPGPLPGRAGGIFRHRRRIVVEAFEKRPPFAIDTCRIGLVLSLQKLDVAGIDAGKKTRSAKRSVVPL